MWNFSFISFDFFTILENEFDTVFFLVNLKFYGKTEWEKKHDWIKIKRIPHIKVKQKGDKSMCFGLAAIKKPIRVVPEELLSFFVNELLQVCV